MIQPLRPYQARAVDAVRSHWHQGTRSVCLVAPTGAGKTRLGEELVADEVPALWIAHRRELIQQTAKRLTARFGKRAIGAIMPGEYESPKARIQVATVQTLLARSRRPKVVRLVLDEAHHYAANEWRQLADAYPHATTVGLTATPERGDGTPLGDIFTTMIVAAKYSQLIADGHLVRARVYRPAKMLGNDLAQDPVRAWTQYSEGSRAFVFCARVEIALSLAKRFRDAGVRAGVIDANTPARERDETLELFRRGTVRIITNVNTMTEGVDVPEARTVILARAFGHVGGYLQAVGRVLRPAKDKLDAILVDLTGASIRHGLPTDDREYSLDGRPISGTAHERVGDGAAPEFTQEVRDIEMRMVAAGALPPGETPAPAQVKRVDEHERRAEFERLRDLARRHRMRDGFATAKYREKFGEWPREEWLAS